MKLYGGPYYLRYIYIYNYIYIYILGDDHHQWWEIMLTSVNHPISMWDARKARTASVYTVSHMENFWGPFCTCTKPRNLDPRKCKEGLTTRADMSLESQQGQHVNLASFTSFTNSLATCRNPPTPAFAKAGAAPGTTGGVELGSLAVCPASNLPNPSACRLPAFKCSKRLRKLAR